MHTFRSDEMMFEGDDLGEAHALELETEPTTTSTSTSTTTSTPTTTSTSTWTPTSRWTPTSTWAPTSTYVPPAPHVPSNPIGALMSEIPMSVWKRLAVYPFALWMIVYLMLPCRLSGRATIVLFVIGAIGIAGAWIRYRAHDRFMSPID